MNLDLQIFIIMIIIKEIFTASIILFAVIDIIGNIPLIISLREKVGHIQSEKAYNKGVINFQKPISCHLYPVRINEYDQITAINYHSWSICSDACKLGKSLKIPIYKFVKKALIRKFGISWFNSLERISKNTF